MQDELKTKNTGFASFARRHSHAGTYKRSGKTK
jgi:hypothetical protein